MLDWLIIGGGLQGHHLAARLVHHSRKHAGGPAQVRILDPHAEPFAVWRRCTRNLAMEYMRSPQVHHLGVGPFELRQFARTGRGRALASFQSPYSRPSLQLFDAHCDAVIESYGLGPMRLRGAAQAIAARPDGMRVETEHGALETRNLAIAIGTGDRLSWPQWTCSLHARGLRIHHVFEPGFGLAALAPWRRAVVIGGGITAAQVALALSALNPGTVTLISRHPIREHMFDSAPGWIGPKYLTAFHAQRDLTKRRTIIRKARNRGSMPPQVAKALLRSVNRGAIELMLDEVQGASVDTPSHELGQAPDCPPERASNDALGDKPKATANGQSGLTLAAPTSSLGLGQAARLQLGKGEISADLLVLATGTNSQRPGDFLDRTSAELGLPLAPCGYPEIDGGLRWHPRIRVMGALAELEIGPIARNISGAREAALRITKSM